MVSAVRVRTEYCRFHIECPGLYIFALLAKEHPFRECVLGVESDFERRPFVHRGRFQP